jgi:hypothetical protein
MQRRIDALLDQAEEASDRGDWRTVRDLVARVRAIDAENDDAAAFLAIANAAPDRRSPPTAVSIEEPARSVIEAAAIVERLEGDAYAELAGEPSENLDSFAGGRYRVLRFLGEGGKKRVFLAHDALLDRDVAFSLIKTEGLDDVGRERIMREAQAMGRLTHQHIVAIYDIGEHVAADGTRQPYLVQELMGGGDVEDLLKEADGALPLPRALEIAIATARGLEFAHAQGIVHRDLKPGNVWLTSDGTPKIGDLGLAVTLGQTRLTSHGMMVGTYQYMPPEQALGHEVTPRADLYSLGAMLYELVTGRPPFAGETPTAVISQHLNAQPVAPSWYSDSCPPELESLILRLLAKSPDERPSSAAEVLGALQRVDPAGRSAPHSVSANPLDRLARGVFVGRERELDQLRAALDAALEGRGSVVMLVGEPGIGKTRTIQELETYARMRRASVFWGRSHEAEGAPAYWPWLQIGNAFGASASDVELRDLLAGDAAQLQVLFADIRRIVPDLPEPESQPSEAAQFQLFAAYTNFFRRAAERGPLMLVLDDLHWADKPTLQLLQHIAGELADRPLLIVGTYRDTELARTHPLSETLASMNRVEAFTRVNLRGLSRTEVAGYLSRVAGVTPESQLVDRVFEETEGNAFFLHEVVRLLVETDRLDGDSVSDIEVPEGVREALGRRLDRLSPEANDLLRWAAIIGREFTYDTLQLLDLGSDPELLSRIEEGLRARVISEMPQPGRYQFEHALMLETLLDELSITRQVQMHGRVAEALEHRYGDEAETRAARLARHFFESASLNPAHAKRAYRYSLLAGRQAERQSAWSEAARLYRQCSELSVGQSASLEKAEMLEALGRAERWAAEFEGAVRDLSAALESYRSLGDWPGVARSALELVWLRVTSRGLAAIDEALAAPGDRDPLVEAELLAERSGLTGLAELTVEEQERDDQRARSLVAGRDAPTVLAVLAQSAAIRAWGQPGHLAEARPLFDDGVARFDAAGLPMRASACLNLSLNCLGSHGDLEWLERAAEELQARAAPLGHRWGEQNARLWLARIALLRGDLAAARLLADEVTEEIVLHDSFRAALAATEGDLRALERETVRSVVVEPGRRTHSPNGVAAHSLVLLGQLEQARNEFDRWAVGSGGLTERPRRPISEFLNVGDALLRFGSSDLVRRVYDWFAPDVRLITALAASADAYRGFLALRLDLTDEADQHFAAAVEWCTREGCPIELGRAHQGLAEVADLRGDADTAHAHLDTAGELFSRHDAHLYLERVISRKEILKA